MTNIILQHFDGKLRELDVLSVDNIKKYAEMVGAEYHLVRCSLNGLPLTR